MKHAKANPDMSLASRGYRLGIISARKVLGEVVLEDFDDYMGRIEWGNDNGRVWTDLETGEILSTDLWTDGII